jgi:hypothetical protein
MLMCSLIGEVTKHRTRQLGFLIFSDGKLALLTRAQAGMKAASQNYASTARSVLAMWLGLNSRSVQGGSRFR